MRIDEFFMLHPETAVAFSGGVDSSYLVYLAKRYADKVCAYYVRTQFQPQFEYDDALAVSRKLDVPMITIEYDILSDDNVRNNPDNRCYYCKKRIFSAIMNKAKEDGFETVIDGTNADDDVSDRPGMTALSEYGVLSPLRICGITKQVARDGAKQAGLPVWDKPSYACLATRIPAGQMIDEKLLQRTEEAEDYLSKLGFRDFRVRTRGNDALIQIVRSQDPLFEENRGAIFEKLGKMYNTVTLDKDRRDE